MALDNSFCLKTEKDVKFFKDYMIEELGYAQDEDPHWLVKEGVVSSVSDRVFQANGIEDSYGFKPNISIYFRVDKFEKFYDGFRNLMDAVMEILKDNVSDAVLLGPGGETMLLYKDDKLILQKESWTDDNLSIIDRPYILQEIEDM